MSVQQVTDLDALFDSGKSDVHGKHWFLLCLCFPLFFFFTPFFFLLLLFLLLSCFFCLLGI